jgi:hypothetical protein
MSHLDLDFPMHRINDAIRPVPAKRVPAPVEIAPRSRQKPAGDAGAERSKMHITGQFRDTGVMVYDFKRGDRRIELRVDRRVSPDSTAAFAVTLILKGAAPVTVGAEGATRLAALEELEKTSTLLEKQDWIDIREALAEVRAL